MCGTSFFLFSLFRRPSFSAALRVCPYPFFDVHRDLQKTRNPASQTSPPIILPASKPEPGADADSSKMRMCSFQIIGSQIFYASLHCVDTGALTTGQYINSCYRLSGWRMELADVVLVAPPSRPHPTDFPNPLQPAPQAIQQRRTSWKFRS